jgi:hypothetical protein
VSGSATIAAFRAFSSAGLLRSSFFIAIFFILLVLQV